MLLDARKIVEDKIVELKERASKLNKKPKLVIIRVGDDPASEKYVNNKIKRCKEVGIESDVVKMGTRINNHCVAYTIDILNKDEDVTGILLQLPLPKGFDEKYLTSLIAPEKDVDGFTAKNMGNLVLGEKGNVACTPSGIIDLLKYYKVEMESKDVLILNRSNIVGKPLAHLFLKENATVTIAHSRTKELKKKIWNSDIVVLGVGIPKFAGEPHFKPGTTIIDVSINFDEEGKMCGDVYKKDYEKLIEKGCNITPVPNGIGQMTVMALIEQTIRIAEDKEN